MAAKREMNKHFLQSDKSAYRWKSLGWTYELYRPALYGVGQKGPF